MQVNTKTIYGEINKETAEDITAFIVKENLINRFNTLNLIINSEGGDLVYAFTIIDMIKNSKIPVWTIGTGSVASSGLLIFISGFTRIITPNASVLSHYADWTYGEVGAMNDEQLQSYMDERKRMNDRVEQLYIDNCNLDGLLKEGDKIKILTKYLKPNVDVYVTSEQLVNDGLADAIIGKDANIMNLFEKDFEDI